ncbi:MAG: hypothetical protein K2L21_02165, partial [Muribaculaceae bacterium]|nr:hypothetical protein [Muribaculaceae bacterium]
LGILSGIPWGELSGNRLKDFNLFADILHSAPVEYVTEEIIDPALADVMSGADEHEVHSAVAARENDYATVAMVKQTENDSSPTEPVYVEPAPKSPRVDGHMTIEDYSSGSHIAALKNSLGGSHMRCAMIGDSYIEGDIFSGSIRKLLQDEYGGEGVGYVPMKSAVAGFRRTVRLSSEGFKSCDIRNDRLDSLHTLPGEYFRAENGAKASFKGEKNGAHTAQWSSSKLIYLAPSDGVISTSFDGVEWVEHPIEASSVPQCISIEGATSRFDVRCNVPGLIVFGAWLDGNTGISYDCMSLRGYSGISHRSLSIPTARGIARWIDYDLIVVEYGMNALSSQQSNYTTYGNIMKKVLLRLKAAYPRAVIIMLGVGDRGQKQGGEVASLRTASAIVDAQRKAAREAGVMFWDTREAMGGENSIVEWRKKGLVNADYIHLNHKGGEEMGRMFVESLKRAVNE